jgi:CubicO group peptidase (beta-lactamase class C family)
MTAHALHTAAIAQPEEVGLSSQRLEAMDRFFRQRYIEPGRLKGLSTLVWRRGHTAHVSVMGEADAERSKPFAEDTILRIYSMTKPLTSVALMMLVEEGLIALDDPVSRYIPEWKHLGVYNGGYMDTFATTPVARPMQVVDLLRHTSGLTYGFQQRTNVDAAYRKLKIGAANLANPSEKVESLEEMVKTLAKVPLEFSPGEAWNYSVSTDVVGYLVQKVSGQKFEDFLKARLLEPLGMVDTDFHVPADKVHRFAACYARMPGGIVLQDDPTRSPYLAPPDFVSGGGGLVSTLADYLKFCRMILAGGTLDGRQYLSPKTIQLMGANHLPGGKDLTALSKSLFSEATYAGVGFGLGFATTLDPAAGLIPGTAGDLWWGGAASTFFWIDPAEELIVILMTQLLPSAAYPIRRELRTLVYSAFTEANG